MSEVEKIKKNTFYSLISISSRLVANVVVFWIVGRFYEKEIFGQFTFVHTLATLFMLIADFGFDISLTTEIARDKTNVVKIFQKNFTFKLCLTILAFAGIWIFTIFNPSHNAPIILLIFFSSYMVFATLSNFLLALFRGFERLDYETKVSLIMNIILLIATIAFTVLKISVYWIAFLFGFTRVVGFIISIRYAYVLVPKIKFSLLFSGMRDTIKKNYAFGIMLLFVSLYYQMDTLLLGVWKTYNEVATYQAVYKIILLPLIIPQILDNALIPVLARFNSENYENWKKLSGIFNKTLLIIVLPFTLILFVFPGDIISIVYGPGRYSDSIIILRIYSIILLLRFLAEAYGVILATSLRQKKQMIVVIFATILNYILNYFMIPKYGALGASIVSLVTSTFVAFCYFGLNFSLFIEWTLNYKFLLICLLSAATIYILLITGINIYLSIPLVLFIYGASGLLFYFSKEELNYLYWKEFQSIITKK